MNHSLFTLEQQQRRIVNNILEVNKSLRGSQLFYFLQIDYVEVCKC